MSRRSGFTLIELLVVIAIIAILAAILFPVFARARAKAQQNNCLSNLKQMALAINMYMSDYDEKCLPPAHVPITYTTWAQKLYPYVKNTQIFVCPSDSNPNMIGGPTGHSAYQPGNPDMRGCSYVWNSTYYPYICTTTHGPSGGVASNDIDPNTIAIMDTQSGHANNTLCVQNAQSVGLTVGCSGSPVWAGDIRVTTCVFPRHNDGYNAAYMGGHAKWRRYGAVPKEEFSYGFD